VHPGGTCCRHACGVLIEQKSDGKGFELSLQQTKTKTKPCPSGRAALIGHGWWWCGGGGVRVGGVVVVVFVLVVCVVAGVGVVCWCTQADSSSARWSQLAERVVPT
jgi:hypothetical protein